MDSCGHTHMPDFITYRHTVSNYIGINRGESPQSHSELSVVWCLLSDTFHRIQLILSCLQFLKCIKSDKQKKLCSEIVAYFSLEISCCPSSFHSGLLGGVTRWNRLCSDSVSLFSHTLVYCCCSFLTFYWHCFLIFSYFLSHSPRNNVKFSYITFFPNWVFFFFGPNLN